MAYELNIARARDPLIAITVFALLAIFTTVLRLKAMQTRQIALRLDDFLMLAALVRPVCREGIN
jgi:hypothetical protein